MASRPAALATTLAILYATGCTSQVVTVDLDDGLDVTSELIFTEVFSIKAVTPGDPNSSTEIEWRPVYTVANLSNESIELRDIAPNFPAARSKRDGQPVELVKIRPTQTIEVYRTNDELWDHRPSETIGPPLTLSPGSRVSLKLRQEFQIMHNEKPYWSIGLDDNLAHYLGPLFGLEQLEAGQFRCVARAEVDLTVSTNVGDTKKVAEQPLCMAGAVVVMPPSTPPVTPR
jgi:hypothetical protein